MLDPTIQLLGSSSYGGWYTATDALGPASVVYSFGVGDDISWDLELIKRFGCTVHAFDPDPHAIAWLKTQEVPPQFIFHPFGLAQFDGLQRFYDPYTKGKVSMSTVRKNKTFVDLPVKRLQTCMRELGHNHIDLLKMDIEGSEYAVLPDILPLDIRQLLVEIHQSQLFGFGWKGFKKYYGRLKTNFLFWRLRRTGFELVQKQDQDYTFVRR